MLTSSTQLNKQVFFASYLMAYYRSSYTKLWIQAATVFTVTFMVFCLSMILAGASDFFKSSLFTAGALIGLTGLYLPVVLFVKCRISFSRNRGL